VREIVNRLQETGFHSVNFLHKTGAKTSDRTEGALFQARRNR
jgi:hypothetical protein